MPDTPERHDMELEIMAAMLPQITRLGERVASLETRGQSIERDLAAIRLSLHNLNNVITPLTVDRERFLQFHNDNIVRIKELALKMDELLQLRKQGIGAWRAMIWIVGIVSASAAFLAWVLIHHLSISAS